MADQSSGTLDLPAHSQALSGVRVAFVTRSHFGLLGGAASYFIPTYLARHAQVLVLSPTLGTSDKVVFRPEGGPTVRSISPSEPGDIVTEVTKELIEFRPDIVHLFQSPLCVEYLKALKHGLPRAQMLIDFRSPPVRKRKRMLLQILWRYFRAQMYCDHVLTHSLQTISANLPVRVIPVSEIPPGVELKRIQARQPNDAPTKRLLYVGNMDRARKLHIVLDGFDRFVAKTAFRGSLTLVGGGDGLDALKDYVNARPRICKMVNFTGPKVQNEVYELMAGYDLGVAFVPSGPLSRAPSLKSLEYCAAKLPFLASDTPGHRDYCERFGFRFRLVTNTSTGWAEAFERALTSKIPDVEVRANYQAVQEFDWARMVEDRLLPVYSALLAKGT